MVTGEKKQPALSGGPPSEGLEKAARQELERLLSSSLFSRAHQLWPVLEAIVEQSLGNHETLPSEKSIGRAALGRNFDPTSDSTVRVRLREIRNKLGQYYRSAGAGDPIEIQVPKGGYKARFVRRKVGPIEIRPTEKSKPASPLKIGVVPFLALVDGISEEFGFNAALLLSQILGSAPGIAVHSSPVLLNVHGPDASLREVSNSFGLSQVVQGTICPVDGFLKATVNLTDTASQTITWSDGFECDIADFGFVRRIADAIASRFAHVEPGSLRHLIIPDNAIAADHYCRGVRSWAERTPRSVSEAESHFRLAAAADPKHAATYAGLANCALFRAILGQRPSDLAPVAIEMAARAVGCDPDSADAHAVLGAVRSIFQHDWPAAEAEYRVAAQLNPDSVDLLGWYSGHLAVLGRFDEAIRTARRLEVLDAHSPFITAHVAKVFYFCGEYDAASSRLESIIALAPQMDMAHGFLGMALCAGGDIARGIGHLERAADLTDRADGYIGLLGHYLAKLGKVLRAQEIAQELESRSAVGYVPATQIAIVWAGLGQIDKVFRCLNQAVEDNDFYLSLLKIWPPFQVVRDDPRFVAVLQRLRLA